MSSRGVNKVEVAGENLRKGSQVYIEGQLRTRKWQDQSGQDKYSTEVVVNVGGTLQMLGGRQQNSDQPQHSGGWGQPQQPALQPSSAPQPKGGRDQGNQKRESQRHSAPQSAPQQPASQSQPAGGWDDDIPFLGHGYGIAKHAAGAL